MQQESYQEDVYGDLSWCDAPDDVRMSVYIKNRIIPVGEPLVCQLILHNRGSGSITANVYLDPNNASSLDKCLKDTMSDIRPGNVAYEVWTMKTEGKGPGDHSIGFYCEPKGTGYYAKGAGRVALGFAVGWAPGKKVGGFSTKYRIVHGIDCPQCSKALEWRTDPRKGWYCASCDGWL